MAQYTYDFTNFGSTQGTTSTGTVNIRSGPGMLIAITVNSSAAAGTSVQFWDATTTSTGNAVALLNAGNVGTYWYDIALVNGLTRACTSSTGDMTVVWA